MMEHKQALSQAEQCQGRSRTPGTASCRPTEGLTGVQSTEPERAGGQMEGWVPSSLLGRLQLALQTLQGTGYPVGSTRGALPTSPPWI